MAIAGHHGLVGAMWRQRSHQHPRTLLDVVRGQMPGYWPHIVTNGNNSCQ
jgi:hypothetical protein